LNSWLKQLDSQYTHILYVDARDVIFQGGLREICDAFNTLKSAVVIGTEGSPWPVREESFAKLFPKLAGGRNYPSAGVFMGRRSDVTATLDTLALVGDILDLKAPASSLPDLGIGAQFKVTYDRRRTADDDQFLWHLAYLNQLHFIKADGDSSLIITAGFSTPELMPNDHPLFCLNRGRLTRKDTLQSGPILHFPGARATSLAHPWAGYLGLL
jgi:hypothetical protein